MLSLAVFKRMLVLAQDTVMGTGLGAACGAVMGLIAAKYAGVVHAAIVGVGLGAGCGFLFGSMAGWKFGKIVSVVRLSEWLRDVRLYGYAVMRIFLVTGALLGLVFGALQFRSIVGALGGACVGVLLGILIVIPVSVAYIFTIGLIGDAPFIFLFFLTCLMATKYRIFSESETHQVRAWRHYFRGVRFDKRGRIQVAIGEYEAAIALMEHFPEAFNNLGYDYGLIGKSSDEIGAYERALALKPDYAFAMQNLAISYAQHGRYEEAQRMRRMLKDMAGNGLQ
jgi:hypothetical protein